MHSASFIRLSFLALATVLTAGFAAAQQKKPDASDTFFAKGEIPYLKIEIAKDELQKLLADTRKYVECTIVETRAPADTKKTVYRKVGIKLKGAAGSYQEFNEKPALTIRCGRFGGTERFHGLDKFHLNNSVQDDTFLNELVGSEIFRAAGVPTPRVTHARVWLNGRDVGLYVLKEGFDELFLSRHFRNTPGNLYDGGFCQDVDADLEKDLGEKKENRKDLKALCAAAQWVDPMKRAAEIPQHLDVPSFLTFVAVELMLGHWDGYAQSHNNYRLFIEAGSQKAWFLPHGMDQILADPGAPILDTPPSIVASAVMKLPQWRAAWRKRVKELLPLFQPEPWTRKIDDAAARLFTVLHDMNPEEARAHTERVKALKERMAARAENLKEQANAPEPKPMAFDGAKAVKLSNWRPMSESEDAKVEELKVNTEKLLSIVCGKSASCVASWRTNVFLPKGKYQFSALVQTDAVAALTGENPGGASVRHSGAQSAGSVSGTVKWKEVTHEFEVTEIADHVELVLELRASKGTVLFKKESLKLARVGG